MIDLLLVRKFRVMNNDRTAETIGILGIVMRVIPICARLVDLQRDLLRCCYYLIEKKRLQFWRLTVKLYVKEYPGGIWH